MNNNALRDEINKRFTLNWLIQGAAQHAGMTLHHLVREELDAIDRDLIGLYDQYALINLLQYWHFEAALLVGWPPRFWRQAATNPKHIFRGHPILRKHGGTLAAEARRRGQERCKERAFKCQGFLFPFRAAGVITRLRNKEAAHTLQLVELAKKAVTMTWEIPNDRLDAEITTQVAFGKVSEPRTFAGRMLRSFAVGYGGVVRRDNGVVVVGKGTNWQLVTKELVKGTAELICLHGLNHLTESEYLQVVGAADGLDFEPWMLHTGGELWRRFLAVLPRDRRLAQMLMHVSRLPARSLESLMLAVLEQPEWATELMVSVGKPEVETSAAPEWDGNDRWDG